MVVGPNQSMLANVSASLGLQRIVPEHGTAPKVQEPFSEFASGVCFQNANGGEIINMNQFTGGNNDNYAAASYETGEQDYTGIGTAAPGAGTYNVGYCVQNYGEATFNDNNWANGYVEVVDGIPDTSGVSQDHPRSD